MAKIPVIDIVIPTYNAESLLGKNLPLVLKNSPLINQVIVVDDGGTDNAPEYLKKNFPDIVCLRHPENLGFSKSVNEGVNYSQAEYTVLLNNDVYPKSDYIEKTLQYFVDPKVFAINFNEENSSWPQVSWHSGKFQFIRGKDKTKPHYSAWPSGGSCVFRKSIWDKLGGLNEIYSPGYWEDIDIGWRAWKSGYKVIWAPESQIVHQHESSFNLKDKRTIDLIKQRNELLFIWQNFTDLSLLIDHKFFLLKHCLLHPGYLKVVSAALKEVVAKGKYGHYQLSDKEVLNLVNQPYGH